jgi:hypothetical protein
MVVCNSSAVQADHQDGDNQEQHSWNDPAAAHGILGNPEYEVEFSPIGFFDFAEVCGGKEYSTRELRWVIRQEIA